MTSSLMWLLAGLSSVLAVGWRCQFLATRDSPWGKLQHGSWLLSEQVIRERKEIENAPKTKMCLLILLLPVPLTPQQATVDPHLRRRLPDTHSPHHQMKPEASDLSQNQSPLEIPLAVASSSFVTTRLHKTELIKKACRPHLREVSLQPALALRKIHYFIKS